MAKTMRGADCQRHSPCIRKSQRYGYGQQISATGAKPRSPVFGEKRMSSAPEPCRRRIWEQQEVFRAVLTHEGVKSGFVRGPDGVNRGYYGDYRALKNIV